MINILVVEDDENYRYEISQELESGLKSKARLFYAADMESALQYIEKQQIHLLVLDMIFPLSQQCASRDEVDYQAGVKLLQSVSERGFSGSIVVLSSQNKTFAVELLIRYRNVRDYIFKDASWKEILHKIEKQVQDIQEKRALLQQIHEEHPFVGEEESIGKIRRVAEKAASLDTTVLLTGESGVGKEVVARYFHGVSNRRDGVFVVVNCAAIPENLFESMLFGHKKGAFTGAEEDQQGAFEVAHRGTLFLDEVGELPLSTQAKLLRVLQEKQVTPVGRVESVEVEVRVIAATNRRLEELVQEKRFREDLYYRLKVLPVHIPPLRERKEDIPVLTDFFLSRIFARTGMRKQIDSRIQDLFLDYGWPGNIRELKNTLERLVIMTDGDLIAYEEAVEMLPFTGKDHYRVQFPFSVSDYRQVKQGLMDAFHQKFFSYHLKLNDYQIGRTAEATGYNRNDLSATIKKLGLKVK